MILVEQNGPRPDNVECGNGRLAVLPAAPSLGTCATESRSFTTFFISPLLLAASAAATAVGGSGGCHSDACVVSDYPHR